MACEARVTYRFGSNNNDPFFFPLFFLMTLSQLYMAAVSGLRGCILGL